MFIVIYEVAPFLNGINSINIIKSETRLLVEAQTTGYIDRKNRNVIYHFIESAHTLCSDKEELLKAQVNTCQRLLKLPYEEEDDKGLIENEISN